MKENSILKRSSAILWVILCLLLFPEVGNTQVPQQLNYQGVVRDASGSALSNRAISLRLSILNEDGTVSYIETHEVTTNQFGLYTVLIGGGTPVEGKMGSVQWGKDNKSLGVEIDPKGGNNYVDMGTNALLSVPYAMYSMESGGAEPAGEAGGDLSGSYPNPDLADGVVTAKKLSDMGAANGQVLKWNGRSWQPQEDISGGTLGPAAGDLEGTYPNLAIRNDVIDADNIIDGSIATADMSDGVVTAAKLSDMGAENGQVLKWDGSTWQPQEDISGGSGGTTGPAGGELEGTYPNPRIADNVIGTDNIINGSIATADVSDGAVSTAKIAASAVSTDKIATGAVTAVKLSDMGAANGQVLKWDGSTWQPQEDISGGSGGTTGPAGGELEGTYPNPRIADNVIGTDNIINGSIATADVSDGAVSTAKIAASAVSTDRIATGAVTAVKLSDMGAANGQVLKWDGSTWQPQEDISGGSGGTTGPAGGELEGTYPNPRIADNVIGTDNIINGSIATADVSDGAVSTAKIAASAVSTDRIATGAVTAVKLSDMGAANGQVLKWDGSTWQPQEDISGGSGGTTGPAGGELEGTYPNPRIADNVIGTDNIINGSIATADVSDGAISTAKIAASAVSTEKIATGAVTAAKLSDMGAANGQVLKWDGSTWQPQEDVSGATGAAGGDLEGTYPNPQIKNNVIGTDNIIDGSVATVDISDGAVSTAKIAASAVSTDKIATDAVTTVKIVDAAVTAGKLSDMGAADGQVLKWDATNSIWTPVDAATGGKLLEISEGGNTGLRRADADPANHGDIGSKAIDLSYSTTSSTTCGATGEYSTAMGVATTASGQSSTAMGGGTTATGQNSTAMGSIAKASGDYSTAMGFRTDASGQNSTAMGRDSEASGRFSTAMGFETKATGENSTAMGLLTEATGNSSTAMGSVAKASGDVSFAMGVGLDATGDYSVAMGDNTKATGRSSTAMGSVAKASGRSSTAMGRETTASGENSTAMGFDTEASGNSSTAMGYKSKTTGNTSTAMGFKTEASGNSSIAMGYATEAAGNTSTAMGSSTTSTGFASTAMGSATNASGKYSTAMGFNTEASSLSEVAIGQYSTIDNNANGTSYDSNDRIFTVGNGTSSSNKSNSFIIYKNGDATLEGTLTQNSDRRLKTGIMQLHYGLQTVLDLNPVAYQWKKYPEKGKSLGLIAQEVQEVISEIVEIGDDKKQLLSVSYTELIPVLIKAIQEQQKVIEQQEGTLSKQEDSLSEQEKMLREQQKMLTRQQDVMQSLEARIDVLEKTEVDQSPISTEIGKK